MRNLDAQLLRYFLKTGKRVNFVLGHDWLMSASVRLWSDDTGLCFEADRFSNHSENFEAIKAIADGRLTGCSWNIGRSFFTSADRTIEEVEDESMHVVWNVPLLTEIGPSDNPAYSAPRVWLSSMPPGSLGLKHCRLGLKWKKPGD